MKPYRVLSLDGGGIRGLYTASLLHQLSLRFNRANGTEPAGGMDLGKNFDLIVGTSTGSILALALAAGATLEQVIGLYKSEGARIFSQKMPLQHGGLRDKLWAGLWTLRQAFSPANNSEPLRCALSQVLGDETFGELYTRRKIAVCIPTTNAQTQKAWVFKTAHGVRLTRDVNYKLVDICMASAAAPIYFPLHGVASPEPGVDATTWFVDGGLWANNPVLIGLAEALEFAQDGQPIHIISIGTGGAPKAKPITAKDAKRGVFGWKGGVDIVSMSLDAQASVVSYLANRFGLSMGGRVTIHRLEDPVPGTEEIGYLALDAAGKQSLELLELLAQRATDLNFSALSTGKVSATTSAAVRDMFLSH